jgi:hypothetical protein
MPDSAANFVADTLKQSTSQFFGALSQTTKFTLDTALAFVDSFAKLTPSMPSLPFAPSKATMKEWLDLGFEATEQILKLQHELATELLDRMAGAAAS